MATASAAQTSQGAKPTFILSPMLRWTALAGGRTGALLPGSHFSRRAAMAPASVAFQSPLGSRAMVAVKARSAASFDRSANRAGSNHGSRPSRVNAVRTVSGMPIFSSPTEANRKSLYSDWPREYARRKVMTPLIDEPASAPQRAAGEREATSRARGGALYRANKQ